MAYEWDGINKISFEEVEMLHKKNGLCGCLYLYMDNTEAYIEADYAWEEIVKHYECGGEFGVEIF